MGCLTPEQVNEAFIQNTPLIQSTIRNMTLQAPNWFRDLYNATPWPEGEGTLMESFKFRGELPEIEEGFSKWALVEQSLGCEDGCCNPGCGYNMSVMGGHAFETKVVRLMHRDFRTPDYCVLRIQNTRQYQEVFSAMIQNLHNQVNFQKEVNIGQNFMTMIAKKFVIDGAGFKPNPADPYAYPLIGSAVLSKLTVGALVFLYEAARRIPDMAPYAIQNGLPTYALVASTELIDTLFRDDPALRSDYRAAAASGGEYANDLITKYNFVNTIRDMFFPVPYMWPRRYRWDAAKGWVRVLPFVKGVPGQVGTFTGINGNYLDPGYATHEEVLIHGANPFSVFYQPTVRTIGEGTDFGPEPGFWDTFEWVNPQTKEDPGRREGYFFTSARIALSADNSEGVMGILVPRKPAYTMVGYWPAPTCPPDAVDCDNTIPAAGCPTSIILSFTPHPLTAGHYFVTFAAPVDADDGDKIQLEASNGGFVEGTVATRGASSDKRTFELVISGDISHCDRFIAVYAGESLGCTSDVMAYKVDPVNPAYIQLLLKNPIKAKTATQVVQLLYGNGQYQNVQVVSADLIKNLWVVALNSGTFSDNVGGIKAICVPSTTDATCGACPASTVVETQCS